MQGSLVQMNLFNSLINKKIQLIKNQYSFKDNPLAVVTTVTDWDEPPRFRHQVTRQLIKQYNVLYVELITTHSLQDFLFSSCKKINQNLIVYKLPRVPKIFYRLHMFLPLFHFLFDFLVVKRIERRVKQLGYKKSILINFQFDLFIIMNSNLFSPKVYLCNDEFPNSAKYDWQKKLFSTYELEVIKKADCCIVHSDPLLKKFSLIHSNVHLILPGHEFNNCNNISELVIKNKEKSQKISVCYMGYIDHRILVNWLLAVVSRSDMFLYLVGPLTGNVDISILKNFDNFKLVAPKEGNDLQSLLYQMDVCIIPFNTELEVVKSCTPNKTFQYIACGKPIVTSNMNFSFEFPQKFFYIAYNENEFIDLIRKAYEEDCMDSILKRINFARQNSWDKRGNQLFSILESINKTTDKVS